MAAEVEAEAGGNAAIIVMLLPDVGDSDNAGTGCALCWW